MVGLNKVEQKIINDIGEYGWHCMNVGAGGGEPNFSYSIGFSKTLGCPEVLIFGLRQDVMHGMLWGMFEAFQSGRIAEPASKWLEPLPGYECELRFLSPSQKGKGHFGSALWYWHKYLGNSAPLARRKRQIAALGRGRSP